MKVVLAGAFGKLGIEILKRLEQTDAEIIAAGRTARKSEGMRGRYRFVPVDVTKPETLNGLLDGCEVLISTVGLTKASSTQSCYDVDYQGNLNLIREAQRAGVKKIHYVSVIACDHPDAEKVPMLHAKLLVERELKQSGIDWIIYRPTGYFYDIAKVFAPYIEKGKMQLLRGYGEVKANVVDCPDLAAFIVDHLGDSNQTYEIGGKETWSYREMAELCFRAAGKPVKIQYVPKFLFTVLANLPKMKAAGKHDILLFSRFTLSHDLVGKDIVGEASFRAYLEKRFGGSAT